LITVAKIESILRAALAPSFLEVIDESAQHLGHSGSNNLGVGTHFRIKVRCSLFLGKSLLIQHRFVYDALDDLLSNGIHALAIESNHA
jgi:BolA protein